MPFVRSMQKVIIIGNVTRDPALRYTANNTPVARFTVATNRAFVNAAGERKEETHFHPIVVWGKFAEKIAGILKKGDKVYIEGRLEYREIREEETGKITARDVSIRADEIIILQRSQRNRTQPAEEAIAADADETTIDIDEIAKDLAAEQTTEEETEEATSDESTEDNPEEELPF